MATRLEDARIRIVLDVVQPGQSGQGSQPGAPMAPGAPLPGGGGSGGAPVQPGGGESSTPEAPPPPPAPASPGSPAGGGGERRRGRRRGRGGNQEGFWAPEPWRRGGARGPFERVGRAVLDVAGARALRGAPRGTGVLARNVLNVPASQIAAVIGAEELVRNFTPVISGIVAELMSGYMKDLLPDAIAPDSETILKAGAGLTEYLNKVVQIIPATMEAGSTSYTLERAKLLLGGQASVAGPLNTFSDEFEIAYEQHKLQAAFDVIMGQKIGKHLGEAMNETLTTHMSR